MTAAHRGSSQTTPNLNVVTNRRFNASMNDTSMSHDEADLNTNNSSTRIDVNGFATLRRQNTTAGTNNRRPTLGIHRANSNDLITAHCVKTTSTLEANERLIPLIHSRHNEPGFWLWQS